MLAPVILSVVALIAGHPVSVQCDPALGGHFIPGAAAWTPYGGNVIYATPQICDDTTQPLGTLQFALGLNIFIHEAAHARGVVSESCAELVADIGVYQVLRDFYDTPFFTPTSWMIGDQVLLLTHRKPAAYQPEGCWSG